MCNQCNQDDWFCKWGHKKIQNEKTGGIDFSDLEKNLLDLDFRKQTIFKFKDDIGTMITFPANWVNMALEEKMQWLLKKLQQNDEENNQIKKALIKLRDEKK
jgi:hypothetical protein